MATHQVLATSGIKSLTKGSDCKLPRGVLLVLEEADKPYVSLLGGMTNGVNAKVYLKEPDTLAELVLLAKRGGFDCIATTKLSILQRLLPDGPARKLAKIDNYAGSIIEYQGMEFLILRPLKRLRTVSSDPFVTRTYLSKLVAPYMWRTATEFSWKLIENERDFQVAYAALASCDLIATDTETARWSTSIRMAGYSGFHLDKNISMTYIIPMTSMEAVEWMRKINDLPVAKGLQNGKYDAAYYARYGAPMKAYYYDAKNMLHCTFPELPKDLGFVTSMLVRNSMYWKDMSSSADKMDQYHYCALDCWATGESILGWLAGAPKYARTNYVKQFRMVPSLHLCEMTGIRRDVKLVEKFADEGLKYQESLLESVRKMVNTPNYNPSSPKQTMQLMQMLGANEKERESSDDAHLTALSYKHPLNERILSKILEYRRERKETSTYLTTGSEAKEFGPEDNKRILYAINPDGTDTGRCASKEHHFWCGLQIQNIGSDSNTKQTFIADPGFVLVEADYSQAEDRGVAHKSGDAALLHIFESGVDSHSFKAAMFFGIAYEEIWDVEKHKVKRNDIRQLGKRVNHGANYNMGKRVLVETMGPKAIRSAQAILKLPKQWDLLDVAAFLLNAYERAFPTVKKQYYKSVISEVKTTAMLTGDTGWTRYCFGDPAERKLDLNAYVAHVTQSLNAMILNEAFLRVFNKFWRNPNIKILAQIHDSILFQVRIGHEYLIEQVKELMTFEVPVKDCFGVTRQMIVPVDTKILGQNWRGV